MDECLYVVWMWKVRAGTPTSERRRERSVKLGGGRRIPAAATTTRQRVGHCSAMTVDVVELGVSRAMEAGGRRTEGC